VFLVAVGSFPGSVRSCVVKESCVRAENGTLLDDLGIPVSSLFLWLFFWLPLGLQSAYLETRRYLEVQPSTECSRKQLCCPTRCGR
jgi:hypothetical protein